MRYFNGGSAGTGGMGADSGSDSGIENSYKDGDNCNDNNTYNDNGKDDEGLSTASGRYKGSSTTGDSLPKTTTTNHQQQQQNLPPTTTSWSPPPPISFRPEQQQQQQQHRVTHGPGGEYKFTYIHIQLNYHIYVFSKILAASWTYFT